MAGLDLGQVLGAVFGRARQQQGTPAPGGLGGMGGGLGGAALGGILSGMLRGRGTRGRLGGNRTLLLAMLLPYAMRWVQRNGGIGAVLKRVQDRGMARQAQSWVATGPNDGLDSHAVEDVVGSQELSQLSQQLGVSTDEVKQGFAELLPEMVNQLTPDGRLDEGEADRVLGQSIPLVEQELQQSETAPH